MMGMAVQINKIICVFLGFKGTFRLNRSTFEELLNTLAPDLRINSKTGVGRPPEPPEKQLLIALCMLANQEVFRYVLCPKINICSMWY